MTIPLILASASPRRRQILARLGLPYTVAISPVDEDAVSGRHGFGNELHIAIGRDQIVGRREPVQSQRLDGRQAQLRADERMAVGSQHPTAKDTVPPERRR